MSFVNHNEMQRKLNVINNLNINDVYLCIRISASHRGTEINIYDFEFLCLHRFS
jgi:hypothetical protein